MTNIIDGVLALVYLFVCVPVSVCVLWMFICWSCSENGFGGVSFMVFNMDRKERNITRKCFHRVIEEGLGSGVSISFSR